MKLMICVRSVLVSVLACAVSSAPALAETIYRWVDPSGRTHFSDVVPDAFKKSATKVESTSYNPAAADKAAAESRAAELKAAAGAISIPTAQTAATPAANAATTPPAAVAFTYDATNCKAWQRKFQKSKNCFDGMIGTDAILTPKAIETCGEDVPNPYPVCGAPDNDDTEASGYFPLVLEPPRRNHRRVGPPCVGCQRPVP